MNGLPSCNRFLNLGNFLCQLGGNFRFLGNFQHWPGRCLLNKFDNLLFQQINFGGCLFGQDGFSKSVLLSGSDEDFGGLSSYGVWHISAKCPVFRKNSYFVVSFFGEILIVECLKLFDFT